MSSSEQQYLDTMSGVTERNIGEFVNVREVGEGLMYETTLPGEATEADLSAYDWKKRKFRTEFEGVTGKIKDAIALSMTMAWNNWKYSTSKIPNASDSLPILFPQWYRGKFEVIQQIAEELSPTTESEALHVTIDKLDSSVSPDLGIPHPEIVGFFGTNGSGKSTAIEAVSDFFEFAGVQFMRMKFPRQGKDQTVLTKPMLESLNDNELLSSDARQFIFNADCLDWMSKVDPKSPMNLIDRFAPIDGAVYARDPLARVVSLGLMSVCKMPISGIIVDAHPVACFDRIKKRGQPLRVTEKNPNIMLDQSMRMMTMTKLPHMRVINTDITEPTPYKMLRMQTRFIEATMCTGVPARQLVRQGMFEHFNHAQQYIESKIFAWYQNKSKYLPVNI